MNNKILKPAHLAPGCKVALISTARKVNLQEVKPAIEILESWELEVVLGGNLFKECNQFSGTDLERIADLQESLDNPDIKAVFCVRGGYGTPRIIDNIDFRNLVENPKWIIGFSDVTVLLCQLANLGIVSLHGPMPLFFDKEDYKFSVSALKRFLFGDLNTIECSSHHLNKSGKVKGKIIGGNLSLIVNSIGTKSAINPSGTILFLEDIDEYLYHIDRMMVHLKRTGILSEISGLIVGHFTDMKDNLIPFGKDAYHIIKEHTKDFNYPVAFNFPTGHEPQNFPIPVGCPVNLTVSNEGVKVEFY